ncbi:aspartate/glutamate racemase family protein [Lacticaseibacillus zhaodongensis]|uniref:aspartate/glutamate racemase family protein n=1 Tax=Lacticaseibacillus zhaodongensis TaxID=2668065 RepID=UPI0012D2EBEC|nr:amino acid racemase [Lacticaseibacillus zhaodongensis]
MQRFFTVIGGMGTAATNSYVRLLTQRTAAQKDQDYMDYLLVNHATVPDRTTYILDHGQPSFYPALREDVLQQSELRPDFMVMVCNTAHYFYNELNALTDVPLLHMPHIAVMEMCRRYPQAKRIGLIATKGTIADHIYEDEIEAAGREVTLGDQHVRDMVMELIYDDIKEKGQVDGKLFAEILRIMRDDFGAEAIVLGCTELSLANEMAPQPDYELVDPQSIIVDKTLMLGQAFRDSVAAGKHLLADVIAGRK